MSTWPAPSPPIREDSRSTLNSSVLPLGKGVTQNGFFKPPTRPNETPIMQYQSNYPPYGTSQVGQMLNDLQGALRSLPSKRPSKTPPQISREPTPLCPATAPPTFTTFESYQSPLRSTSTSTTSPGFQSHQSWSHGILPHRISKSNSLANWASPPVLSQQPPLGNGSYLDPLQNVLADGISTTTSTAWPTQPQSQSQVQVPSQDPFLFQPLNAYASSVPTAFQAPAQPRTVSSSRFHPYQARGQYHQGSGSSHELGIGTMSSQAAYVTTGQLYQPDPRPATASADLLSLPYQTPLPASTRNSLSPGVSGSQCSDSPAWSSAPPTSRPPSIVPSTATPGVGVGPVRAHQQVSFISVPSLRNTSLGSDLYGQYASSDFSSGAPQGWAPPETSVPPGLDQSFVTGQQSVVRSQRSRRNLRTGPITTN